MIGSAAGHRTLLRRLAAVISMSLPLAVLSAGQASAATTYSHTYTLRWQFRSPSSGGINRCINIYETGTFRYRNTSFGNRNGLTTYEWYDVNISNPTIKIYVHSGNCSSTATLTKASLRQDWAGYACSDNPSIGVSYPWGISVSDWPSCGPRTQAGRRTSYSNKSSSYYQYNNGAPIRYSAQYYNGYSAPKCGPRLGTYPTVTGYVGHSSDTYGASNGRAQRVCLPWH